MPHPPQITRDHLIETAWQMAEADGLEALSLAKLAGAMGIKAPSLYHHVSSKAQLLKAVNELTNQRLFSAINDGLNGTGSSPLEKLTAVAHTQRIFAQKHPVTYMLAFTTVEAEARPDPAQQAQSALPLQAIMAEISGEQDSLAALRGALALIHGFIMLELNQQFQRGGDLDEAFTSAIEAYLRGWERG